ncbi:hypothetical protein RB195_001533 [Necator americanus]|uniref:Major facilitator superfamily (MFS) profile domain-containing protein n=1 Tax=Necator americanus TaxID=51031 RepID=A0ABR1DHQ4_NECAM
MTSARRLSQVNQVIGIKSNHVKFDMLCSSEKGMQSLGKLVMIALSHVAGEWRLGIFLHAASCILILAILSFLPENILWLKKATHSAPKGRVPVNSLGLLQPITVLRSIITFCSGSIQGSLDAIIMPFNPYAVKKANQPWSLQALQTEMSLSTWAEFDR